MAKKKRGKARAKKLAALDGKIRPTDEQQQRGQFVTAGASVRRVPVIETLHKTGRLSEDEYRALGYYRDQASLADRSPTRSCLDEHIGGGQGHGPGAAVISAMLETARMERDLGSLRDIARAVAVDDMSLSQWCISQYGGRERYNGKGEFVAMVPNFERKAMKVAILDIRMAARRIVR
ncbi:hypothetical protein GCM10007897_31900 [Sphingobium jiangsuense]|uniref:Uncharacterized protein n=1 Tax=Sphingobium jiangsuense TaxID=870476 RepID=A0A7W6FRS5_9SPHN|nr:hypothetical protein [Sphingobium jiangsuense]MBB3928303.1 hypothetical protein [Sphingobium jiangsuense]GLT01792.1 hypothetical protein GCM10007897_31900 [Sphingobium jiangsuense]